MIYGLFKTFSQFPGNDIDMAITKYKESPLQITSGPLKYIDIVAFILLQNCLQIGLHSG